MYSKSLQLCLAQGISSLWWLLLFWPHFIPPYASATLTCVVFYAVYYASGSLPLRSPLQPVFSWPPTHRYSSAQFLSQFGPSVFYLTLHLCTYCFPDYYLTSHAYMEYKLYAFFATVSQGLDQHLAGSRYSKIVAKWMGRVGIESKVI